MKEKGISRMTLARQREQAVQKTLCWQLRANHGPVAYIEGSKASGSVDGSNGLCESPGNTEHCSALSSPA